MIFKLLACWKLAKKYDLPRWDVFLPTGCDCVLESVMRAEKIVNEHGKPVELVNTSIRYILWMSVPLVGLIPFAILVMWRYKVLYRYLAPLFHPDMNDWVRLLYVMVPSVYYIKVWRDSKC